MDSAGKRAKSQKPVHGPPPQARVAAANRTVLTTSNDDPGAHGNEQGAKQNEWGQTMRAVGMTWQRASRHTQPAEQGRCRRTQPADDPTGQASKKQQPQMLAGLSPCSAGWWWEYDGAGHSKGGLRPTRPVSLPSIAFACHRPYPLP